MFDSGQLKRVITERFNSWLIKPVESRTVAYALFDHIKQSLSPPKPRSPEGYGQYEPSPQRTDILFKRIHSKTSDIRPYNRVKLRTENILSTPVDTQTTATADFYLTHLSLVDYCQSEECFNNGLYCIYENHHFSIIQNGSIFQKFREVNNCQRKSLFCIFFSYFYFNSTNNCMNYSVTPYFV